MKKVLLIDDDEGIKEAVKAILEFADYEVLTGSDYGYIDTLKDTELPQLILLDLLLSGQDGKQIAKKLKHQNRTAKIPIIMLSAHPSAATAALEAGADDFIAKPFDMEELLDKVKKYCK